eukprot:CAMPEP_0170370590 /NCGR_PEP_ID=MMETSP0117_2-20130122/8588_1 /TAXON_ID=400756 /ORGANISM="Durinskia baltica, Strain CSIRO CS-38" /LENGTH=95 /DNA_ID=CAMNT_0010625367 /DNA_START=31 /DNA_END=318 /DNA_ORIENTATION=+
MALQEWINKTVSVITCDGRNIVGSLKGYDQTMNLILEQSHERVFSQDKGATLNALGLYIIRGDNIVVVAELDEEKDAQIDYSTIMAAPLKAMSHS